jgi:hypothetical protein
VSTGLTVSGLVGEASDEMQASWVTACRGLVGCSD